MRSRTSDVIVTSSVGDRRAQRSGLSAKGIDYFTDVFRCRHIGLLSLSFCIFNFLGLLVPPDIGSKVLNENRVSWTIYPVSLSES